ncbi:MFS transporter [Streptomyces sp. NPDC127044]
MTDSHERGTATALLVAGCFFMEMLDGTIVSTAAPQIARDLHTAPTSVGLVITAYLVTLAVLIPLSGWLTARFGPRRVFLTAITVFTLASLACAFAPNLGALVGTRVLQGVGGAMMVPVGRLVVLTGTAKRELPRMVAYIVWPGLVAPVLAPLLGGLITTYASWHWIFLLNVPLGVVALLVAHRLIAPAPRDETPPLDLVGTLLTCTGLAALTWTAHLLSDPAGGAQARTVAVGGGAGRGGAPAAPRGLPPGGQPARRHGPLDGRPDAAAAAPLGCRAAVGRPPPRGAGRAPPPAPRPPRVPQIPASAGDSAARRGPCRKPPGAL